MSSESLSARLKISGDPFAPRDALEQLLTGILGALSPGFLGHIKGVVRFPDGLLYASTVGTPPDVNFEAFGQIPEMSDSLDIELTCIAFGDARPRVRQAVEDAIVALPGDLQIEGKFYETMHQH